MAKFRPHLYAILYVSFFKKRENKTLVKRFCIKFSEKPVEITGSYEAYTSLEELVEQNAEKIDKTWFYYFDKHSAEGSCIPPSKGKDKRLMQAHRNLSAEEQDSFMQLLAKRYS